LIRRYYRSSDFLDRRARTKANYRGAIEIIRAAHGHRLVAEMEQQHIRDKILGPYADRPGQRFAILKTLRILIKHAIGLGWIKHDPSSGIKRPTPEPIRAWTDQEILQFENRWAAGSQQRLAFALMLYTGQRRSDVHRMRWADIRRNKICLTQQKTGIQLTIPLLEDLQTLLRITQRSCETILTTKHNKPFSVGGFSDFMRRAIREAGLPIDCQPHGLRKTCGKRLAEAKCSTKLIMAWLGHKSLAQAEGYTTHADQEAMADMAGELMEQKKHRQGD
jgi:integrase